MSGNLFFRAHPEILSMHPMCSYSHFSITYASISQIAGAFPLFGAGPFPAQGQLRIRCNSIYLQKIKIIKECRKSLIQAHFTAKNKNRKLKNYQLIKRIAKIGSDKLKTTSDERVIDSKWVLEQPEHLLPAVYWALWRDLPFFRRRCRRSETICAAREGASTSAPRAQWAICFKILP
ncbi:MAG: hypothetical protein ACOX88_01415 [Christensenellales bacterium]|jgi:hypothetical protein